MPIIGSSLNISIYNSSILFYSNNFVNIINELIAYNSNISLSRSITTVGSIYDLIIKYDLPNIDLIGFVLIIPKLFGSMCSNCIMNSTHISFTLLTNSS